MVVQHNLTAMNANRNLSTVTGAQQKSTEKLSSGYRINRAADDAAGQSISISIGNMNSSTLKISGLKVSSFSAAGKAMTAIQSAINKVSTERSKLGALQNRLEHTINNLNTTSENTSAAESRIRDVDMATEMVEYSKNNILAQAGQSMLAQANQANQGVLSLLG